MKIYGTEICLPKILRLFDNVDLYILLCTNLGVFVGLRHTLIDAFELWCWKRLLRVPWTARRSNQSILKEISPGGTDVEAETPILWPPDVES